MLEAIATDVRQSLEGTGTAEVSIAIPRLFEPPRRLLDLGFAEEECVDLFQILFASMRLGGAVTMPEGVDVRDEEFAPRNRTISMRLEGSGPGVLSWIPAANTNRRLDILTRILARKVISYDAKALLGEFWRYVTSDEAWQSVMSSHTDSRDGVLWRIAYDRLEFTPSSVGHRPFRCDTCRQVTWRSVAGVPPVSVRWFCSRD